MADKKSTAQPKTSETTLIRELAEILNETDLSEIEMKRGDLKIRVAKHSGQVLSAIAAPTAPTMPVASAPSPVAAVNAASAPGTDLSDHPGDAQPVEFGEALFIIE